MFELNAAKPGGKRREDFLAVARKAEESAAKAASSEVRMQWLRIADGYRHLAELAKKS